MSDYTLFTRDKHEDIRWTYTQDKINRVIDLWESNEDYKTIMNKLRLSKIEVILILIDKSTSGKLKRKLSINEENKKSPH